MTTYCPLDAILYAFLLVLNSLKLGENNKQQRHLNKQNMKEI